jgi:hypothetical protein
MYIRSVDLSPIKFINLWLPDSIAEEILLPHINEMLQITRRKGGRARASHRGPANRETLLCFLLRYFLESLQSRGRLKDAPIDLCWLKSKLMGVERYEEISAACRWSEEKVAMLHKSFNQLAPSLVTIGVCVTIDETLLAYFGEDARDAEIARFVPNKPHPYGLLGYRAGARLRHTRSRVTVALCPVIPGHLESPTTAALHLI